MFHPVYGDWVLTVSCWVLQARQTSEDTEIYVSRCSNATVDGLQTLMNPDKVSSPFQSILRDILIGLYSNGSIAGVSSTPAGTVWRPISAYNEEDCCGAIHLAFSLSLFGTALRSSRSMSLIFRGQSVSCSLVERRWAHRLTVALPSEE